MTTDHRRVDVFFYGAFMAADVLQAQGIDVTAVTPASVTGFELVIRPRPNLVPAADGIVFGSIAAIAPSELERLYSGLRDRTGVTYLPEAVLASTRDGKVHPALCYVAGPMEPQAADATYVKDLAKYVRALGHPEAYARHVESFGVTA